jgi:pimeloyl-ACP methyl ester carboxylesterase
MTTPESRLTRWVLNIGVLLASAAYATRIGIGEQAERLPHELERAPRRGRESRRRLVDYRNSSKGGSRRAIPYWVMVAALIGILGIAGVRLSEAQAAPTVTPATIVLVHGAFAGSSSWNGVITELVSHGYKVIAAANPLRGLKSDADYVSRIVKSIPGPVVLVGHSYGGEVITEAAYGAANVKALVFVAGLAPDAGESANTLGARFPTGTLGQALAPPVPLPDDGEDLYILQDKYWKQFAADVPEAEAIQMAATQRPCTKAALGEASGPPAWRTIPSWFIYGSFDRNIPRALHDFMAHRAGAREIIEVKGASHVVMISHAHAVAALIERAASAH